MGKGFNGAMSSSVKQRNFAHSKNPMKIMTIAIVEHSDYFQMTIMGDNTEYICRDGISLLENIQDQMIKKFGDRAS